MGAAEKTYLVAMPPGDAALAGWAARGWLRVYGGGAWSSVLRLAARPSFRQAEAALRAAWARDAEWIAARCERNALVDPVAALTDPEELPRRRRARAACRDRMARMQVALLLYAYASEPVDAERARRYRRGARSLGWMASLVGDEATIDFRTPATHRQMRRNMRELARAASSGRQLEAPFAQLVERYADVGRGGIR
jgi:hypothetical protein